MPTPIDLAEEAVAERMKGSAALVSALGHAADDERIVWGRPVDVVGGEDDPTEAEFPLVTFHAPTERNESDGYGTVTVQIDVWAWPSGPDGGIAKVKEVDELLYDLFYRVSWENGGRRFSSWQTRARGGPEPPGAPLSRTREVEVGVS